jgi:hypothetical protein
VLRLHQLGIGREEFKELVPERVWQLGQALQPRARRDRLDSVAEGCGSVDELLGLLPRRVGLLLDHKLVSLVMTDASPVPKRPTLVT